MKAKGLGPMLAAMLLIAIVISMSAFVYIWSTGVASETSFSLQSITKKKAVCQGTSFYIDDFAFVCQNNSTGCALNTDKNFTLKIRNTGDNNVLAKNLYIRNSNSTLYEFRLNTTIIIGDETEFIIPTKLACAGLKNEIDEIIVTTDCPDVYDILKEGMRYMRC